ncbi:MAG: NmrA family NAD(P)-binding protein [Ardenticatenaceae bacterium]|nr:NmrA family NAD(P)-binding protein [Ardenticatenaceae bacterium]
MDDRASLEAAFDGMTRVFSVQNWTTSGVAGEIRQGKLVADVAKAAGVTHLVFGSAGVGEANSGVPHFDCKIVVEKHMRDELGLPVTVVRPGPFMELMTDKAFFPPLAAWGVMPKIVGWDAAAVTAVTDIGPTIANDLDNPQQWIGRDINLISDGPVCGSAGDFSKPPPAKTVRSVAVRPCSTKWPG